MRNKVFTAIAVMIIGLATFSVQAVEDKPQMGVSLNAGRELGNRVSLLGNMCFINLMSDHSPYTSLGLAYKFNDHYSLKWLCWLWI